MDIKEKEQQQKYPWNRNTYHSLYNNVLAYYQSISCLENSQGDSLLDLACGDGTMTKYATEKFKRVVGVDASATHLAQARERLPNVEFHESLIEDFNTDEKFDNVFLLMVLEHVQDAIGLLKKSASFLKPGGNLIVHVPNANAINRQIAVKMGTLLTCDELSPFDIEIAGHRRSYTLETLQGDAKKAGLKIKHTGGVFYKMLSTPQIDWFLKNGEWNAGHGWGRTGVEGVDWMSEFCRACYEIGKERPEDCNVIYICATI